MVEHASTVPQPYVPPLASLPARTLKEVFRAAGQEADVDHAALLGDLQLMQRALSEGGHRSVLCWNAQQAPPFVLRLGTVTLTLRPGPEGDLQSRLSVITTDGSLRPVLPDDLSLYAREFIACPAFDLVPVLLPAETGETLRKAARNHAEWTRRASEARSELWQARLMLTGTVCAFLMGCPLMYVLTTPVIATGGALLLAALLLLLAGQLRRIDRTEDAAAYRRVVLKDEIKLLLGFVPVGPAVLPGVPPVPEFNLEAI